MTTLAGLTIGIVAGEESGDLLGADLVRALTLATGREVRLVGVGGRHLEALGLKSEFEASEIALVGVSAVLRNLPSLWRRIGQTARTLASAKPDCIITIDSPDFALRVARKVRAAAPSIPIVHYVCPSVWAWRPGRAKAMRPYIDHILCLLPFEPAELERLEGPPGTFVGHRLVADPGVAAAARSQLVRRRPGPEEPHTLLLLPGSRRSEVAALLDDFRQTVEALHRRGSAPRCILATVPHVEDIVRQTVALWPHVPEVVIDPIDKWKAFGRADAALAASGTVLLELALSRVPAISCYRLDWIMKRVRSLVTVWSAALPNIVADRVVVPEYYDDNIRPELLARQLEAFMSDTPARQWQLDGYAEIARRMATGRSAGKIAADTVLGVIARGSQSSAS